ncbi:RdgB/HAM1 family non-canonical purine NTP pyrophosphatase [Luteolibacter sp. AS25]|uniref:RdgB/HAM1 family non-canonical purine NTP pyrophosphatase n=1 Tax=Luteolibacter sp. AS25 TaxID=3135776 RepID=UPI00398A8A86
MQKLPPLILATRNAHKTEEIRHLLGHCFEVMDVTSFPDLPEIEETGTTFLENARLKALGISSRIDGWVLADDSGLEVDALDGEPGVYSSSYGGEEGNHTLNNQRLLKEMAGKENRSARFRCTLVLAKSGEEKGVFRGTVDGNIADNASGTGGFGYDPLFIPAGHDSSLADLGAEIKSTLSHRANAIRTFTEAVESGKII